MAYIVNKRVAQDITNTNGNKVIVYEPFNLGKTVLSGAVLGIVFAIVEKVLRGFNGVSCRKTGK